MARSSRRKITDTDWRHNGATTQSDADDAATRAPESSEIKQVPADESLRRAHAAGAHARGGALGPVARTALLIGLLALVGLLMGWLLLVE